MATKTTIDCVFCEHYYVTWDKDFPKGCKLFGFKSKNSPSLMVFEATGASCQHFVENSKRKSRPKKDV